MFHSKADLIDRAQTNLCGGGGDPSWAATQEICRQWLAYQADPVELAEAISVANLSIGRTTGTTRSIWEQHLVALLKLQRERFA